MVRFLDLKAQHAPLEQEIETAITEVSKSSVFVNSPAVGRFEEEFANYLNARFCLGVGNGSDALEIAIEALNLPRNSEIILPANTFIATAEAVIRTGHRVVFCDYSPHDYLMDPSRLEACISDKTAAIIPVHLYGQPADMPKILEIARKWNLKVIEDAAQAHGADINGQKAGVLGDIGCFSFYPGKNLGAFGDAGAIVCQDEDIYLRAKMIANHGRLQKYDHQMIGRNSRLDAIQAAILSVKLKYLDAWNDQRIQTAKAYEKLLGGCEHLILPTRRKNVRHVFHLYVVRTSQRGNLIAELEKAEIQFGIHYPSELPDLPPFQNNKSVRSMRRRPELSNQILSLPMGPTMKKTEIKEVAKACLRLVDAN